MKFILFLLLVLTTTLAAAQSPAPAKVDTVAPYYVIQYEVKDTVNNQVYAFVLYHTNQPNQYIFAYSGNWGLNKAAINKRFAAYNPIAYDYTAVQDNTWQFNVAPALIDPDEIFSNFVVSLMYAPIERLNEVINKKAVKK